MSDKNAKDALAVKLYKTAAALRRAERKGKTLSSDASATKQLKVGDVLVVRLNKDAKPLSELGGVQKVLGRSRIRIPEYKLHRG
ncbi:hypothetical protein [Pseudoduganella sp. R-34]|uniref:hypothetical protein n=1 Tax=Pseudoduganella sp. R-34 TaxID=3404062 RepID=UPI003CF24E10